MLLYPGGVGGAELVERIMQGFQHTFYTMQCTDRDQDMRGIGPLGASCFAPAARFAGRQEGIEEPWASFMGHYEQLLGNLRRKGFVPINTLADYERLKEGCTA